MNIVTRKLNMDMHGPNVFAVCSEQELMGLGYVWEFNVFRGGYWVRSGLSMIKDERRMLDYVSSGMGRLEWEAIHGKD